MMLPLPKATYLLLVFSFMCRTSLLAEAKSCPYPSVPLYARVVLSDPVNLRSGSTAEYKCDDGYELFGSNIRTCSSSGKWSADLPYCAVNVAYGKPTNQSSTVRGGESRNANDGSSITLHENKHCTETKNEPSPWWVVDLLQPYEVKVIRILTRGFGGGSGHSPLHDLEIRVGNSTTVSANKLCAWFPGTLDDGVSKDLSCAHAIKGRFVYIQMVGVEASLSLCEVDVFTTKEFSGDRCGSLRHENQQLIPFNQTCYEFQTNAGGSFTDAIDYCKGRGGFVVNNVDNVTHNFLYYELERLKSKLKSKLVWLGAKRELSTNHPSFHRSRSNTWKWVDGEIVRDFLWAEDQPNNYNGQQNCIVLDGGRRWLWNDVTCDLDYLPWICQYNPSNCGSPDREENTTVLESDFRIGKEITYRCPEGYTIEGVEKRKCLPNGFWSHSPPTCRFVNCGSLPDIARGRVILVNNSRTSFNATALYQCDKDFTLVGNETRVCLSNGSWSGETPKCMFSWCPELSLISSGHLTVSNRTINGTASYSCARGHKLQGNETRICQLGGKWSGDEPTCRFIDCGIPLDTRNGRYLLLNATTTYQSMVKYSCHENYTLIGNETRNCTEHATWSGLEPSCKLIDCSKPEVPLGAELIGDKFTVGSEVKYKCKPGHKLISGSEKRKCRQDGKWDNSPPECKFIDCGRVPVILKGEVKYVNSSTFLDSIVNYTCSYGFRVSGVKTRVCKDDGKWSESSPKCEEIRCVPPEVPKNSSVVYSGNDRSTSESFKVGSTVQYRCSVGHIVRGESLRTCESHGSWSGDPPVCAFVDCGFPYVVANGRWLLTTNTTHYGSTVEYECVNNYKISGSARRLCLENGTWSSHAPVCEVINCGQPPVKDDKTLVEGNSFFVGEKVHYSCQYGYELVGEEIRICDSNAQWSHEIPHCRIVDCGRPPVLPNGRGYLLNSTTTYDSVIEYHCMSEFKLIGDPIRRCLATGSWSGSLPRCLEITLINEMSENDIDSRADSSQSILASGDRSSSSIHPQMENSRAMSIGISIGIAALLILIMVIGIVCLKTKKPQPVKNTETHVGGGGGDNNGTPGNLNHLRQDKENAVMSYSRLSLESEAALAAAANHHPNGGSVRHLPNGLVTFAPVHQNGISNGHVKQSGHNNHHRSNNHNTNNHRNHQQTHPLQVQQNNTTSYSNGGPSSPIMNGTLSHNNNHNHHNSHHNQHPLIRGSNGNANHNGAVTGSTISVAIRSNQNNGAMSPASMSPRYVTSPSPGPQSPTLPGQHQVMTNGRSIMTTTTTLEV